jgi:hypothetical protein
MLKTLTAALIAASVLIAPLATQANAAQPATKAATTTTKVVKLKSHKRHFARHHKRVKFAKHARHHGTFAAIKKTRHGKIVKAHRHAHVVAKVVKAPKTRTN